MPSAASSAIEPVGMDSIPTRADSSPSFMIAPLPNWRSICCTASSSAFERSLFVSRVVGFPAMSRYPLDVLAIHTGTPGSGRGEARWIVVLGLLARAGARRSRGVAVRRPEANLRERSIAGAGRVQVTFHHDDPIEEARSGPGGKPGLAHPVEAARSLADAGQREVGTERLVGGTEP